jgi:hypothetical protein
MWEYGASVLLEWSSSPAQSGIARKQHSAIFAGKQHFAAGLTVA